MADAALLVLSDLDGTLLDHTTYAFDAARAALERLRDARVPLVLCTSKTRAEVEPICAALPNAHPFIVENGGGGGGPGRDFPLESRGAEPPVLLICHRCRLVHGEEGGWMTTKTYREATGIDPLACRLAHADCPSCHDFLLRHRQAA